MTKHAPALLDIANKVRLPQSHYLPPASPHVLVLGIVQGHAFKDAWFSTGSSAVVPVVPIELHNQPSRRNYRVGDELSGELLLREVVNSHRVKERIPGSLCASYVQRLLHGAHRENPRVHVGVRIPTRNGAVLDVVVAAGGPRRGPTETVSANLTYVRSLVSALVRVVASVRAEGPDCNPVSWEVKLVPALLANNVLALLSLRPRRTPVARKGAVLPSGWHSLSYDRSAGNARDGPNFVTLGSFCHTPSISRPSSQLR